MSSSLEDAGPEGAGLSPLADPYVASWTPGVLSQDICRVSRFSWSAPLLVSVHMPGGGEPVLGVSHLICRVELLSRWRSCADPR
jgi:hypothetical protein